MPDGTTSMPISLRLPADVLDALDKVASAMERPRSWVVLRAIRQYLADEGREVLDVQEGLAEAERGETVDFAEAMVRFEETIATVEAKRPAK